MARARTTPAPVMPAPRPALSTTTDEFRTLVRRHLVAGWAGLLLFLLAGIGLEALHAFKLPVYLDARNETRRLMWTLAHAHGSLLSLVVLACVPTFRHLARPTPTLRFASVCLIGASAIMPLGFFLGGTVLYEGDPGAGVIGVPVGAVLLLVGVSGVMVSVVRGGARGPDRGGGD